MPKIWFNLLSFVPYFFQSWEKTHSEKKITMKKKSLWKPNRKGIKSITIVRRIHKRSRYHRHAFIYRDIDCQQSSHQLNPLILLSFYYENYATTRITFHKWPKCLFVASQVNNIIFRYLGKSNRRFDSKFFLF